MPFAVVLTLVALALPHHPGAPSRAAGQPWAGRLINGVELPAVGPGYLTWDPIFKRVGNRPWRRWGTDRLLRTLHRVLGAYAQRHPDAQPVLVGDLSRPRGGDFGPRFGGIGHPHCRSDDLAFQADDILRRTGGFNPVLPRPR